MGKQVREHRKSLSGAISGCKTPLSREAGSSPELGRGSTPSWAELPVLSHIFDLLEPEELGAVACVCKRWAEEASQDHRWRHVWAQRVSDQGLWRWARAHGGYREQLRANSLVRKGDCVASVFPFNRIDGAVTEVLLLDGPPEPHVVTVQNRRPPAASCIRLQGATIKVWTSHALCSQRSLIVVHDVVKHLQLEDGRLFMWRIADNAFIRIRSEMGAAAGMGGVNDDEESRHWAEHPALVASVLDPTSLTVTDVPLESTYGRCKAAFEWMDMCTGAVASADVSFTDNRVSVRLFDLESGVCFRESTARLVSHEPFPMTTDSALMLMSRNSDAEYQVIAAAALFDSRVFRWRLRDEWLSDSFRKTKADKDDDNNNTRDPAISMEVRDEYRLHQIFETPDGEPVVDLSISTAAGRIYVIGLENLWILGQDGVPQIACSMLEWRGVRSAGGDPGGGISNDVGAFSWPLPNSNRAAFYLDVTNSLFVGSFERPGPIFDFNFRTEHGGEDITERYPRVDRVYADSIRNGVGDPTQVYMHSHTDLRMPPRQAPSTVFSGRTLRPSDTEHVIVEYVQSGEVLFTSADASCTATGALLRAEKSAGTYLSGLGPRGAPRTGSKHTPTLVLPGNGSGPRHADVAPRALVCIDAATGRRFKAIPVEGPIEAVHSAGHFVAMAVAPLEAYPDGTVGSLVVLDFRGQGFGLTASQRREQVTQKQGGLRRGIHGVQTPWPAARGPCHGSGRSAAVADGTGPSKRRRKTLETS